MGGAHEKDGSKSNSLANSVFFITILFYVLAISYLVYSMIAGGKFMSVAEGFFQLTKSDVTMIPVGAVAFYIFWKIFDNFIFSPHLKLVEERESQTTGAIDDADEIKKEITTKEDQIRTETIKLRKELSAQNEKTLKEKEAERQSLIASKSEELKAVLKIECDKIESQKKTIEENLFNEADQMIEELISKLNETPKFSSQNINNN